MLFTAVEGGNPPRMAVLPQPGLMQDFVKKGALKPIEYAKDTISQSRRITPATGWIWPR